MASGQGRPPQQQRPAQQQPSPAQQSQIQRLSPEKQKVVELGQLIEKRRDAIAQIAGKHFDANRLVKLAQWALTSNTGLVQCNPGTVLVCLIRCAELGLEPNAAIPQRRMWLVPRKNDRLKEGKECTYVVDYRAKMQIARDTGLVPYINAGVIFSREVFEYEESAGGDTVAKFRHVPLVTAPEAERGEKLAYYAVARLENGQLLAEVWPVSKMQTFRARHDSSRGSAKAPWATDFDAMAKKTMLNQLFQRLPAGSTPEQQKLQEITAEETSIEVEGKTVGTGPAFADLDAVDVIPEGMGQTTDSEVENAIAGGKAAGEAAPAAASSRIVDPRGNPVGDEFGLDAEAAKGKPEPGSDG
jgi:recombination protein RecT